MKTNHMIVGLVWLVSLVLVYAFASRRDEAPSSRSAAEMKLAERDRGTLAPAELLDGPVVENSRSERFMEAQSVDALERGPTRVFSAADYRRQLPKALESRNLISDNLLVAELLAGLTKENLPAALEAFEDAPRNHRSDDNFRLFMYAWAQIDGAAAVEYGFLNPDGRKVPYGGTSAMAGWASQQPEHALAYIESLDEEDPQVKRSQRWMIEGLVWGWSDTDLDGAGEFVSALPNNDSRGNMIETLTRKHIQQRGVAGALRWANKTAGAGADEQFTRSVFDRVALQASREDAKAVALWVDQNVDSPFITSRAFEEAADEWAETDPESAGKFIVKHLEDERVNPQVVGEFVEEWSRTKPEEAAAWVDRHLANEKVNNPEVVSEVASEWAERDPAATVEWIAGMDNEAIQRRGFATAVGEWAERDAAAAGEWLNKAPGGSLYDPAIEAYASRIARETPVAALSWSMQIENPETRERSVVRSAQSLYRQDEEAVMEWLPESGLSERAKNAVVNPPRDDRRGRGRR